MSLGRARILKASASADALNAKGPARAETLARRVPSVVMDARAEADRILREATAAADGIVADARAASASLAEVVAREAREQAVARVLAELVAYRVRDEHHAERQLDRTLKIARLLAERVIGETIALEPARIQALAKSALEETRGARKLRIEACPDDMRALETMLAELGDGVASLEASDELARGSLVVHTELGRIDAQLAPQLGRLAEALREALGGGSASGPRTSRE